MHVIFAFKAHLRGIYSTSGSEFTSPTVFSDLAKLDHTKTVIKACGTLAFCPSKFSRSLHLFLSLYFYCLTIQEV